MFRRYLGFNLDMLKGSADKVQLLEIWPHYRRL